MTHVGEWRRLGGGVYVRVSVHVYVCGEKMERRWREREKKSAPGLMMCLSRFTNEKAQCLFPRTMWY